MIPWRRNGIILRQNKIFSLLGIAMRGHNLVSGEVQTLEAVKNGSARLVILAEDASHNTAKLFTDKCGYYEVPVIHFGTKESLGHAIGRDLRSSVGVCDAGLADSMIGLIKEQQKEWKGTVEGEDGGKHGEDKGT